MAIIEKKACVGVHVWFHGHIIKKDRSGKTTQELKEIQPKAKAYNGNPEVHRPTSLLYQKPQEYADA